MITRDAPRRRRHACSAAPRCCSGRRPRSRTPGCRAATRPTGPASTPPQRVSLTFNEPMQAGFATLTVIGPDGNAYQAGDVTADGGTVEIGVAPLGPAGRYEIGYRVVSEDGHPVTGSVAFTLTAPVRRPRADPAPACPRGQRGADPGAAAARPGRGSTSETAACRCGRGSSAGWCSSARRGRRAAAGPGLTRDEPADRAPARRRPLAAGGLGGARGRRGRCGRACSAVLAGGSPRARAARTTVTRAGMDVAAVRCVGLALVARFLPRSAHCRAGRSARVRARGRPGDRRRRGRPGSCSCCSASGSARPRRTAGRSHAGRAELRTGDHPRRGPGPAAHRGLRGGRARLRRMRTRDPDRVQSGSCWSRPCSGC